MTAVVRELRPAEWPVLREIRLRTLATNPAAFAATFDGERAQGPMFWRRRMADFRWFCAANGPLGQRPAVGLLGGRHRVSDVLLVAMWVDPGHRGRGVAGRLIDAVRCHADRESVPALALQVNEHNRDARMSYVRRGFHATGDWEELESGYRRETMRPELAACR